MHSSILANVYICSNNIGLTELQMSLCNEVARRERAEFV